VIIKIVTVIQPTWLPDRACLLFDHSKNICWFPTMCQTLPSAKSPKWIMHNPCPLGVYSILREGKKNTAKHYKFWNRYVIRVLKKLQKWGQTCDLLSVVI
jgi:hypothetical protein